MAKDLTETIAREMNAAASLVKFTCGVGNNAAWAACLEAYGHIQEHPDYRRDLPGGFRPCREWRRCFDLFKSYERGLLWTDTNRFFHVADMPEVTRRFYGVMTDREYYDFWASFGFKTYEKTRPFFTSLVNKLRLAIEAHGEPNAVPMAWAWAAAHALGMAVEIYRSALKSIGRQLPHLRASLVERVFRAFDLTAVRDRWRRCCEALQPGAANEELTATELRNIQAGYDQLARMWMDDDSIFGSRIESIEDYAELFRTPGMARKAERQIAEMRDLAVGVGRPPGLRTETRREK